MAVILELTDHEAVELVCSLSLVLSVVGAQLPAVRRKRIGALAERLATYYPGIVARVERRRKRGLQP